MALVGMGVVDVLAGVSVGGGGRWRSMALLGFLPELPGHISVAEDVLAFATHLKIVFRVRHRRRLTCFTTYQHSLRRYKRSLSAEEAANHVYFSDPRRSPGRAGGGGESSKLASELSVANMLVVEKRDAKAVVVIAEEAVRAAVAALRVEVRAAQRTCLTAVASTWKTATSARTASFATTVTALALRSSSSSLLASNRYSYQTPDSCL